MIFSKNHLPLIAVFALIACTSTKERAQKLLESGQYEGAATAFEIVLRGSPLDAEAQAGLVKSREGIISNDLLKVRSLRLANQNKEATQILEQSLEKQSQWQVAPQSAVASTMAEESHYAISYLKGLMLEAVRKEKPLLGVQVKNAYPKIVASMGNLRAFSDIDANLKSLGQKDCAQFEAESKKNNLYHFHHWTKKYCSFWGRSIKSSITPSPNNKSTKYSFGKIDIQTNVQNSPQEFSESLKSSLRAAIEASPFYLNESKTQRATGSGSGQFRHAYFEKPENYVHSYIVKVPYTDYESRSRIITKKKLVCRTKNGTEVDASNPVCRRFTPYVTSYDDTVWEQVPVTRVREEPRNMNVKATGYTNEMGIMFNFTLQISDLEIAAAFDEHYLDKGIYHLVNNSEVGLKEKPLETKKPIMWLGSQRELISAKISEKLKSKWIDLYCKDSGVEVDTNDEQVHACISANPSDTPAFVEQWFQNKLGISRVEAQRILSK